VEELIMEHMYLAKVTARKYSNKGVDYEDLVQEGMVGLVRATKSFDPDRGVKFSTYAMYWVRQAILSCLTSKSRTIRLPNHIVANKLKVNKFKQIFMENFGFEPDIAIIARELEMDKNHVAQVLGLTTEHMVSSEFDVGMEDEQASKIVEDESHMNQVVKAIRTLSAKERLVIGMKFGLVNKV
jgi:RNA polymerase sigma factor (sigma-70 family)